MGFQSTKTWGPFSAAFRQHSANSHCRLIHGYGLTFTATFHANFLNEQNWVMDFGGLRAIKAWLEDSFDHKVIISRHDPLLELFEALQIKGGCELTVLGSIGCESFARHVGIYIQQWLNDQPWNVRGRVGVYSVECREHSLNSAIWIREP